MKIKYVIVFFFMIILFGCQQQTHHSVIFSSVINTNGEGIDIQNQTATIVSGGSYTISGNSQQGQLVVAAENQNVELILDNLNLSKLDKSPIYIKEASVVTITLKPGTKNSLTFLSDTQTQATIQSEVDLVVQGQGQLVLASGKNCALSSNKTLVINDGVYKINSGSNGIQAKESLTITNGEFAIESKKTSIITSNVDKTLGQLTISQGRFSIKSAENGMESSQLLTIKNGHFDIESELDALTSVGDMTLYDGEYTISAHQKGIYSQHNLKIVEGIYEIKDSKEGIVSNNLDISNGFMNISSLMQGIKVGNEENKGDVTLSNGIITIDSGNCGVDINGNMYMNGGKMYINGPNDTNVHALQVNQECVVRQGTLVLLENNKMTQFALGQPSFLVHLNKVYEAPTEIVIKDKENQMIIEYSPIKNYQSFLISSDKLQNDGTYQVYINQELLHTFTLDTTQTIISI